MGDKNMWKCGDEWETVMLGLMCDIQACNEDCQPLGEFVWAQFVDLLAENDIYSLYGPNWENDLETICNALPADSDICDYLSNLAVGYPDATQEISVRQLDLFAQQAFTGTFA